MRILKAAVVVGAVMTVDVVTMVGVAAAARVQSQDLSKVRGTYRTSRFVRACHRYR